MFEIAKEIGIKDIDHEGTCSRDPLETPAYKRLMGNLDEQIERDLREQAARQEVLEALEKQARKAMDRIKQQDEEIK